MKRTDGTVQAVKIHHSYMWAETVEHQPQAEEEPATPSQVELDVVLVGLYPAVELARRGEDLTARRYRVIAMRCSKARVVIGMIQLLQDEDLRR
jgi:hypothetical protein